jgi:predicted lipoprotein with Yx(FWY)xxD motif
VVVATGALGLQACNNLGIAGSTTVTTVASAASATVDIGTVKGYGKVLETSGGHVLYLLTADHRDAATCAAACLRAWPPLLVKHQVKAGPGVQAKLLSSFQTHDGLNQVAYNGHPLYTFAQDASPGSSLGEGVHTFGGTWWMVSPAGKAVTRQQPTAS